MAYSTRVANERRQRTVQTAGCIIIGDEVLGGKTVDTNSSYFAKYCFRMGITLKKIEVIGDDEAEIVEAARRMSDHYDFVVTSGGIGPTHDDITYQSIARAYNLPLIVHNQAFEKMRRLSKPHPSQPNFSWDTPSPALDAKKRMINLPYDEGIEDKEQVQFVDNELWVPISVVNGNIHILPGVPRLFERLLEGLRTILLPKLKNSEGESVCRMSFSTPLAESAVAPFLTQLAEKTEPRGVKVGSYPRWGKAQNTVTLVGRDKELMETLAPEVEKGVQGRRIKDGENSPTTPQSPSFAQ
ncbi:MAG: hypothetical protein M1831_007590 [Alyxoria varia]|nr:MAG: hypothetical protein M1831_007590 [Alyxoria varia]